MNRDFAPISWQGFGLTMIVFFVTVDRLQTVDEDDNVVEEV